MPITVIEGLQRGDEGKGGLTNRLAAESDIVAGFNGGTNAGHTTVTDRGRVKLHVIPSGILHPHIVNVVGNGKLVDPTKLGKEFDDLHEIGVDVDTHNFKVSSAAHLILPYHISLDEIREAQAGSKQGSTQSGISFAASDKVSRIGVRASISPKQYPKLEAHIIAELMSHRDLRDDLGLPRLDERVIAERTIEAIILLGKYVTDTQMYLNEALRTGKRILAESAQASLLDLDHGMYPDVTSTNTGAIGVTAGLGVSPKHIDKIIGVVKGIPSHVGNSFFITEEHDPAAADILHGDLGAPDAEFGTTSGRKRRLGHMDLPALRRALIISGPDQIHFTKLDWLSRYGDEIPVCDAYIRDGDIYPVAPDTKELTQISRPNYFTLQGWTEDIGNVTHEAELPKAAQTYLAIIEAKLGVPILSFGVGQLDRQIISRKTKL